MQRTATAIFVAALAASPLAFADNDKTPGSNHARDGAATSQMSGPHGSASGTMGTTRASNAGETNDPSGAKPETGSWPGETGGTAGANTGGPNTTTGTGVGNEPSAAKGDKTETGAWPERRGSGTEGMDTTRGPEPGASPAAGANPESGTWPGRTGGTGDGASDNKPGATGNDAGETPKR